MGFHEAHLCISSCTSFSVITEAVLVAREPVNYSHHSWAGDGFLRCAGVMLPTKPTGNRKGSSSLKKKQHISYIHLQPVFLIGLIFWLQCFTFFILNPEYCIFIVQWRTLCRPDRSIKKVASHLLGWVLLKKMQKDHKCWGGSWEIGTHGS